MNEAVACESTLIVGTKLIWALPIYKWDSFLQLSWH